MSDQPAHTYIVTDLSDDLGDANSLRSQLAAAQADISANSTAGDGGYFDEVTFAPGLTGGTVTLGSTLTIGSGIVLDGTAGGASNITISGNNAYTVFTVPGTATPDGNTSTTINNLTIADGASTGTKGAGGSDSSPDGGPGGDAAGGIFVEAGHLSLSNDTFANDTATGGPGGAGYKGAGGGAVKGAGGNGGNAAGAVYVEPGAVVDFAQGLVAFNDTATAGFGGFSNTDGPDGTAYPVSNDSTIVSNTTVCYASGTLIRTVRGNVAVEALCIGDRVLTSSGAERPIRWLGHRRIACATRPRPSEAYPVRIAAHAFGPNRPMRDLFVSPGHSICVDVLGEVLIPAIALVNGSTIVQVAVDEITYWHVELDGHDILLAENLACESYLDMGNRGFFGGSGVVDLDAAPDAPAPTHADFCRPFHDGGPLVDVLRAQLAARAAELGWRLDCTSPFGDLHLVVDGVRIEPLTRGLSARFMVPADACDVWLVSSTARACDVGAGVDTRDLGMWLAGLTIEDGFESRTIALDDPLLCVGFHAVEAHGRRWTTGRARLPAALFDGCEHGLFLRVDLAGPALPRWVAAEGAALDQADRASA